MVIYEITATVEDELVERFENYMRARHVPEIVATGCFERAEMSRNDDGAYRVRYYSKNREMLENYFSKYADELRRDFIENFPNGVEVERGIWNLLESWG